MQQVINIFTGILTALGMAADAKSKLDKATEGRPPKGIGKLNPNDPVALGDFTFELMQADGKGEADAYAKQFGFANKAAAEKGIEKIWTYNGGDESFNKAVGAQSAARTQQMMDEIAADPMAFAREYQDMQPPA